MLDTLPAWLRHLLILVIVTPAAAAATLIASTVIAAHGVDGVQWDTTVNTAAQAAANLAAAGILGFIALYVTPITSQYGVGATPANPTPPANDTQVG